MNIKRQCFWLLESEPSTSHPNHYRVCQVTENKPGYRPTGGGEGDQAVEPWYWDHQTCAAMNEKRHGLTPEEVDKIVASSMFCNV